MLAKEKTQVSFQPFGHFEWVFRSGIQMPFQDRTKNIKFLDVLSLVLYDHTM